MGNLRACTVIALLAACGSDKALPPDAHVAPDAKIFNDAPPPSYDFSCLGANPPSTAPDPITISGITGTYGQSSGADGGVGLQTVAMVVIETFTTNGNNPIDTVTSDANGAFTTGNLTTGGAPLDGYVRATKATYRTSYLYPAYPLALTVSNLPVPLLTTQAFGLAELYFSVSQDDTANGALIVAVTDCANTPVAGATLTVQQNNADVGTPKDLGAILSAAAGAFVVFNVPDGVTQVSASYNGMTFPTHTVTAYKKPNGSGQVGTLTVTPVRPGP